MKFTPRPGSIIRCQFPEDHKEPEMVKTRPVVVLSSDLPGRSGLVNVVAISTVAPNNVQDFHYLLPRASMPMIGTFQDKDSWVKGDMIYTMGYQRLEAYRTRQGAGGTRKYFDRRLGREQMAGVYSAVLHGIGLGAIAEHL